MPRDVFGNDGAAGSVDVDAMRFKGSYLDVANYVYGDVVTYGGASYVALRSSVGQLPGGAGSTPNFPVGNLPTTNLTKTPVDTNYADSANNYYSFQTTATADIAITVTRVGSNNGNLMRIYNAAGTQLATTGASAGVWASLPAVNRPAGLYFVNNQAAFSGFPVIGTIRVDTVADLTPSGNYWQLIA